MTEKARPRVLFVIGTMGGGGAERQVIEILKRLDRARFEPFLYLAMKQGELLDQVPVDVPIFAFWDEKPESLIRKFFRYVKLTRIIRYMHLAWVLHQQRIDVIYDRTYLATLDAAGGCVFRPTPRISCCVVDPQPELELHSRFFSSMSWWFARRAYRSARIVLANSEGLRVRVIEYFRLKPEHVRVFHNLLAVTRFEIKLLEEQQPHLRTIASSEGTAMTTSRVSGMSSVKPFLIVTAGRLHAQKGQRFLLEAIEELIHREGRSIELWIFGKGEMETELRQFVRAHNLESHVKFHGFVNDLREQYRKADLFVLPSLYEGMPNALIEAAATGIPVVSTDCPSGPYEILEGGQCGRLVPTGNSQALAEAIADAMDHPEDCQIRAALAQKRVQDQFNPELGIRRLEELLLKTIESI